MTDTQPPLVDISATAREALARAEAVLSRWLPDGKRQGPEWLALNPTRADDQPGSFSVNTETGAWADFATGDQGRDLVSLVRYLDGLETQGEAARRLAEALGITATVTVNRANNSVTVTNNRPNNSATVTENQPAPAPATKPRQTLEPIPKDALASRPKSHSKHGQPSAEWCYCSPDGQPLAFVQRFDPPDARKQFSPQTWDGSRWQRKAPPEPRPLYGLDRLAARPEAPALLCEGEKAADAAAALVPEAVAIASMNGAQSPKKSDWSPLQGRRVLIWPDHDEPGAQYARSAGVLVHSASAASAAILDLKALAPELPDGWDAADALADGWTPERFANAARWLDFPSPFEKTRRTERTRRTASNGAASSGSPNENPRRTERTARPKPEVERPAFAVHDQRTGFGPAGLWWHGIKDEEEIDQWVCSPLHADAMTCSEADTEHGLLLRFRNAAGRWREWSMPMALLKGSGEELRGELLALGVRIDPASHRLLNAYLMSRYPERRVLAATATGWHMAGKTFVLPNRIIGTGDVRFQSEHAQHDEFVTAGTLDGWRADIAARCIGNPMMTLAVSAALAGPLLAKVHRTSGGFHLVGDSSTGKSTALAAGASVWGGGGFIRTWRATSNGLEGIASALNDTALILDEISEADPRELGAVIYAIGNGTGKSRANRSGGTRAVRRWRVMLLSSGERTIGATMLEGGRRAKAGQEARLLDIPCARRYGLFDDLRGMANGRALSDAIRTAAAVHYGHAGPAFVERLIADDSGDLGELLAAIQSQEAFASTSSLEGRAAGAFALVALAGELATSYGLTGWPEDEALESAAMAYQAWREHRGTGHTETRQILEAVEDFIAKHSDARFSHVLAGETGPLIRDRAGWYRDDSDGRRVYLFTAGGLREATAGFDFKRVLDALDAAGWIAERDEGRRYKTTKLQGRTQHPYAIAPKEVEL
jgi:putative DNA primase/helicase